MRLISILLPIACAAVLGCAADRRPLDLFRDVEETLDASQNLAIVLHDQVGDAYQLVSATYLLDGRRIYHRSSTRGWTDLPERSRVYRGYSMPGPHTLTLLLEYMPNDYGVFTYARGYRFKVTSQQDFTAPADRPSAVHVVIRDLGGPTARLADRPDVLYYVTSK